MKFVIFRTSKQVKQHHFQSWQYHTTHEAPVAKPEWIRIDPRDPYFGKDRGKGCEYRRQQCPDKPIFCHYQISLYFPLWLIIGCI
jgi:hypothetical protein